MNSTYILVVLIYQSTHESHEFLPALSAFLEHLADSSGHLIIIRDFNIHVDVSSDHLVKKFNSILKMHRQRSLFCHQLMWVAYT